MFWYDSKELLDESSAEDGDFELNLDLSRCQAVFVPRKMFKSTRKSPVFVSSDNQNRYNANICIQKDQLATLLLRLEQQLSNICSRMSHLESQVTVLAISQQRHMCDNDSDDDDSCNDYDYNDEREANFEMKGKKNCAESRGLELAVWLLWPVLIGLAVRRLWPSGEC